MKRFKITLFSILLLGATSVYAQCGTDEYTYELLQKDSIAAALYEHYVEHDMPGVIEYRGEGKMKKATRVIPVVFHIIHTYGEENISKEQILNQLELLNKDFSRTNSDTANTRAIFKGIAADMDIEFRMAQIAPDGSCTDGITRTYSELTDGGDDAVKNLVRWDYRKYLNIWVINRIERGWDPPYFVAGYAVFPFQTSSATDGIVIRQDRVGSIGTASGQKGRTLTHEIGHWLGLYHPFQGGCTSNNSWTDQVDDTPPVKEPSYGCPIGNNTCSNDNPNQLDQIENFMDYADDACANMFSNGQKARIEAFLNNSSYRGQNISSATLTATGVNNPKSCAPIADFYTSNLETVICEGSGTLSFTDFSYNGDISSREWIFEGGSPSTSGDPNPEVSYSTTGYYDVTLIVGNGDGFDTLTRTNFISVLPSVAERKAPFGEDFENEDFLLSWNLETSNNDGWILNDDRGSNSGSSVQCYIDENTNSNVRFSLSLPPLDVRPNGMPLNIHFDYAYSRSEANSTEVMLVLVSEDCGDTWKTLKGLTASNGLASVSGNNPGFVPTSQSHWAHYNIDINGYSGGANLIFRFDVISKAGNSVFLDNINIAQFGLGIESNSAMSHFSVYPNPTAGNVTLISAQEWIGGQLEMTDLSGRLLLQSEISAVEQTIDVDHLSNGIYQITILKDGIRRTEKLIINR